MTWQEVLYLTRHDLAIEVFVQPSCRERVSSREEAAEPSSLPNSTMEYNVHDY